MADRTVHAPKAPSKPTPKKDAPAKSTVVDPHAGHDMSKHAMPPVLPKGGTK